MAPGPTPCHYQLNQARLPCFTKRLDDSLQLFPPEFTRLISPFRTRACFRTRPIGAQRGLQEALQSCRPTILPSNSTSAPAGGFTRTNCLCPGLNNPITPPPFRHLDSSAVRARILSTMLSTSSSNRDTRGTTTSP